MKKRNMLILMCAIIFITSCGYMVYGALMPAIREFYGLDISQTGLIGTVLSAGQLAILLFSDFLAKRFSNLRLTAYCVIAYLACMLLIFIKPPFALMLGAFFVVGMSISLLIVVMCAYISDAYGDERNRFLNYFHGFYGIGSLVGPLLPTLLGAMGFPWPSSFAAIAVLCALGLLPFLRIDTAKRGEEAQAEPDAGKSSAALLSDLSLRLVCYATVCYVGMNMMLCSWISSYMTDVAGAGASMASLSLTIFWVGAALGRLSFSALFGKFDTRKYLIAASLVCAVALVGALVSRSAIAICVTLGVVGFLVGVNFPLLIGLGCSLHPRSAVGATNDVSIAGSLGGMIFPSLIGLFPGGYAAFVALCGILLACVSICMLLLGRAQKAALAKNP